MELDDKVVAVSRGVGIKAKTGNRSGLEADLAQLKQLKAQGASAELVDPLIQMIEIFLSKPAKAAATAAGRRKMSRKYCKKTVCKKMGFTQRASCRPYKNCFTRRTRLTRSARRQRY